MALESPRWSSALESPRGRREAALESRPQEEMLQALESLRGGRRRSALESPRPEEEKPQGRPTLESRPALGLLRHRPRSSLAPVQGTDGQGASSHLPEVTKFIQIADNYGKDAAFPLKPSGEEMPQVDSDDDGDAPSGDVSQAILGRRNQRFLAKHSVKVQMSSETIGVGLFVTKDWPAGAQVPVKGPWFETLPEVQKFLAEMPDAAQTMFGCRVVRVFVSSSADRDTSDGKPEAIYKVITCLVGFVNHFTGLSNQPNCVLTWVSGVGLGEYTLTLKTTKIVKAGGPLLLNCRPFHQCSAKPRKVGAKAASKKTAAGKSQTKEE